MPYICAWFTKVYIVVRGCLVILYTQITLFLIDKLESSVPLSSEPENTSIPVGDTDIIEIEVLETLSPKVIESDFPHSEFFFLRLLSLRILIHLYLRLWELPPLFLCLRHNQYMLGFMVSPYHTNLLVLKTSHKKSLILLLLFIWKEFIYIKPILLHLFNH